MAAEQKGITSQEPEYLTLEPGAGGDEEDFSLDEMKPGTLMYDQINYDFESAGLQVEKVEKLTNTHIKQKYITERDLLYQQRVSQDSNFKLNEKFLYHGTTAKKTYICEEGLDYRVSKQGCFGRGIYFSDYPRKCIKYAEKGGSTESIILLMRVILGDAKVYPKGVKDKTLVREPEKPQPYTGFRFYDSVEGCPVNHKEFVVYENRRALVECIITYKKLQNPTAAQEEDNSRSDTTKPLPQDDYEDSDTSLSDDDDRQSSTSEDDDDVDSWYKREEKESNVPLTNVTDDRLQELEHDFSQRTGLKDKHLIHVFLLMGNMVLDEAVNLYKDSEQKEKEKAAGDQQGDLMKMMENLDVSAPSHRVNPTKWKAMSPEDREAATQYLIDDFLDVIGRDKQDDDSKTLARRYLTEHQMNLDLAIITYYDEL